MSVGFQAGPKGGGIRNPSCSISLVRSIAHAHRSAGVSLLEHYSGAWIVGHIFVLFQRPRRSKKASRRKGYPAFRSPPSALAFIHSWPDRADPAAPRDYVLFMSLKANLTSINVRQICGACVFPTIFVVNFYV